MKSFKKVFCTVALSCTIISSLIPTQIFAQTIATPSSEEKVIIVYKDKADKTIVDKVKGKVGHEFKNIKAVSATVPTDSIESIKKDPNVSSVEKDFTVQVDSQTMDWGITNTNTQKAWSCNYTGKGVKVAVIDTGIAPHPDLVISGGISTVGYTTSYTDDNGHGTHVAGIIGAKNNKIGTVGVAPNSELYAVKVMDNTGSGYVSDIIEGIDWSISNNMNIINLSLGTSTYSSALETAINNAYADGILVVAAAGNNGTSDGSIDTVDYPAKFSSAIAVAATDKTNTRASFSATGSEVEVAAPGVNVLSTYLNGGYAQMSGTSMATPYTSGILALLKQANPTMTNVQLRALLDSKTIDLGDAGKDKIYGYGLVQAPYTITTSPTITTKSIK